MPKNVSDKINERRREGRERDTSIIREELYSRE